MIQRLQQKRDEGGFTLIELLIVIIVLAILAAIVVFAVSSTRSDSVHSACKTDVKSIELSAEAVNTKMGSYPAAVYSSGSPAVAVTNPATRFAALLAGNTLGPSGASNGALLKTWPSATNYVLDWDNTNHVVTVSASGTAYGTTVLAGIANGCDGL